MDQYPSLAMTNEEPATGLVNSSLPANASFDKCGDCKVLCRFGPHYPFSSCAPSFSCVLVVPLVSTNIAIAQRQCRPTKSNTTTRIVFRRVDCCRVVASSNGYRLRDPEDSIRPWSMPRISPTIGVEWRESSWTLFEPLPLQLAKPVVVRCSGRRRFRSSVSGAPPGERFDCAHQNVPTSTKNIVTVSVYAPGGH